MAVGVATKPEPSPSPPPEGVLPDKVVTLLKEELEDGRQRVVPGSVDTLGERFEAFRSMLWHLTRFFQGPLEYQNQIDLITRATRLAQDALIDQAFDKDGLVAYAKRQRPLRVDPKSLTPLQQQIQELALGPHLQLEEALLSASITIPAYWDWVVEHPNAGPVQIDPEKQLYVQAITTVKRCLFIYTLDFDKTVETLAGILRLAQASPGTA
jgi:hypothetical protein